QVLLSEVYSELSRWIQIPARSIVTVFLLACLAALIAPPMPSSSSCLRRCRTRLCDGLSVCNGSRDSQLDLCSGIVLTPHGQLAPNQLGAFMHPGQTVVSGARASLKNFCVNALSVVPDVQPKLPLVVSDFHFDPARVCMPEGIANPLGSNPVDIIPY